MTHEFSLMADLFRKIDEIATQNGGGKRVVGVKVRLGALAHISPDHFREHFEQSSRETIAEGAKLDVYQANDVTDKRAQDIMLESVELES